MRVKLSFLTLVTEPINYVPSKKQECIVQLSLPHSQDLKYLHLNNLIEALENNRILNENSFKLI